MNPLKPCLQPPRLPPPPPSPKPAPSPEEIPYIWAALKALLHKVVEVGGKGAVIGVGGRVAIGGPGGAGGQAFTQARVGR